MGDVISSHLDEGKREMITACTRVVLEEFGWVYEQQYAVALFNNVRFEIEGGGGTQTQLLHRKDPLKDKCIFSGSLYKYLEENKKWRHRFLYVDDTYNIALYENKQAHERGLHPKGNINCAGYRALNSMEEYLELLDTSLPGVKAKASSSPFLRCPSQYPLILWHPYARHHYFCVMTEKEHSKWHAVLQDCVRHVNNGLSEESTVQTPAFTDAVRLYRQSKGHYGTWDMMCGEPAQILANLVMETLHPELRTLIVPRLKGKLQQRQRNWMLISDAVYKQVLSLTRAQHEALVQVCEAQRPRLDATLRTDMDQIINSKDHITGKIRSLVLPKADQLLRGSVQSYISSILEALMDPISRGFAEVRSIFFGELVEVSKNTLNHSGGKDRLGEHMDKLSMLAFHPVKMRSCYEKVDQLSLDGLQQRFDFSSPSVFIQRAQILMREEMDNAVYTFEQLLHQVLGSQGDDDLCKAIQGCQDRVLKKYDYDSSSVRKKFFREALLQIIIPFMLKQLSPVFANDLPRFQELIFEDFSRFILVENVFEEVVLQSVTKDIMMAVKEAAVQRRHNLYRDSIIMTSSDPNLHLLEDNTVNWSQEYGGEEQEQEQGSLVAGRDGGGSNRRRRQIVSMIQLDGISLPYESCMEVPGVEGIPEESEAQMEEDESDSATTNAAALEKAMPESPDSVQEIRGLLNPGVMIQVPAGDANTDADRPVLTNGVKSLEEGEEAQRGVEEVEEEEEEEVQREISGISPEEEEASSGGSLQNAKQSTQEDEAAALCQQEVETPVATSQEVETSVATSQEVETPVATSQEVATPVATSQEVETPVATSQEVETSVATSQEVETPVATSHEVETPVATSQEVETPVATSQEVETPVATSQVGEMPAASASTQEDHGAELPAEIAVDSDLNSSPRHHDDSGFQSPTNEALEEEDEEHEKAESRSAGEVVKASALDPEEVLLEIGQPHTTDVSPRDTVQNGEYATDILL
ncbi:protein Niban 2a [Clupea harengus]|uniref:Protein Niban 2a n=1 Tax=Clupea harengus TaxID=7950 RepID=A0A6P8GG49_CLUHA|nr:protein Niban 2a [Clupea harengus]